jgi:amidophosphoribosyltransferase
MELLQEACGVYGVYSFMKEPVLPYIYWGLIAQNHRGHQSYGFTTFDGMFHCYRMLGLIPRMKRRRLRRYMSKLPGSIGIGNVRYSTSGLIDSQSLIKDMQPVVSEYLRFKVAISYNGNVVNVKKVREDIEAALGSVTLTADSELICKKILLGLLNGKPLNEAVKLCMEEVEGGYSVIGITGDGELFAFRDRHGIKPLCLGFSKDGQFCAISSETVGLAINDFNHNVTMVDAGEIIVINEKGVKRKRLLEANKNNLCGFEFAYFARPDSLLNGSNKYVYEIRTNFGRNLGRIAVQTGLIKKIDCVVPVPETADDAAYGFHIETGIRLERALRRHRYVTDRAFITLPYERRSILDKKINVLGDKLKGTRIALVDDSIVRGDTTKTIIERLRASGVKEIHVYLTFPRIVSPCFYGIDMATFDELIGFRRTPEEIARLIGADSINYQPVQDFVSAIGLTEDELCLACVTGKYPTPMAQRMADEARDRLLKGWREKGRVYEGQAVSKGPDLEGKATHP